MSQEELDEFTEIIREITREIKADSAVGAEMIALAEKPLEWPTELPTVTSG